MILVKIVNYCPNCDSRYSRQSEIQLALNSQGIFNLGFLHYLYKKKLRPLL